MQDWLVTQGIEDFIYSLVKKIRVVHMFQTKNYDGHVHMALLQWTNQYARSATQQASACISYMCRHQINRAQVHDLQTVVAS